MDPSWWLQSALSIAGGGLGAYVGIRVALSRLEERVRMLEVEIGTHDTGLRGSVHRLTNAVIRLGARFPDQNHHH